MSGKLQKNLIRKNVSLNAYKIVGDWSNNFHPPPLPHLENIEGKFVGEPGKKKIRFLTLP